MRYVILRHEVPSGSPRGSHWDLMFEVDADGELRTWAVEQSPDSPTVQDALALPDHRREYLTYEGPISGDRGTVARWDEGTYELLLPPPADGAGSFVVRVAGHRLQGTIELTAPSNPQYSYHPATR